MLEGFGPPDLPLFFVCKTNEMIGNSVLWRAYAW